MNQIQSIKYRLIMANAEHEVEVSLTEKELEHIKYWYSCRLITLETWAREQLPDDLRKQFFCIIANDVAKYFAIIPAMLIGVFPVITPLNIMGLQSASSAVLSAVIFNALIIIALIPLALRGVHFRPVGAGALLRRNLLIYGLGGLVVPFIGIKFIDIIVNALHLV